MKLDARKKCGETLRRLRLCAGMTQRDVAEALRFDTAQFVSNWERGVSYPSAEAMTRLPKVFGVPARELVGTVYEAKAHELDEERRRLLRGGT